MKTEFGVYVHIPFCKKKCSYCDFVSFSNQQEKVETYVNTLIKEIDKFNFENYNVTTIYIGGGTPSYIKENYIEQIIEKLKEKLLNNETKFENIEITIEINPGTITKEKINKYKQVGINRVSMGLQSTNNKLLTQIGRIHTYEEFLEGYKIIKNAGFENINVDLMIGLPNQTIKDIKDSLNKVIELQPTHISVYSLIVEQGTSLYDEIENEKLQLPSEELERQMYWYVKDTLELNGFNHYEISNFAKKGYESKHNVNCWKQKEYIGFGLSAHSYINKKRFSNTENLKEYIQNCDNKIIQELQNTETMQNEYMILGLRTIEGVSISKFKEKFVQNPIYIYRKQLKNLTEQNLILIDGDSIKLTNKGLDFANLVWEEFI